MPPLTPQAETRRAPRDRGTFGNGPFESTTDFTNYDRCITRGIVGSVLPVVYGNGNRILQTPNEVVISYEMVHDTRVIPLDGRPHIGSKIRQYLGDARGHWEGNTLVVETTNLTDQTSIGANGNGLRHSADMKIVERFTRNAPDELQYEIHIDDPKTYTRPFTMRVPLISPPGFQLLPYDCHEGNYMLRPSWPASAPRTRRSRKTPRRASSARESRCRRTSTPRPARRPAKAARLSSHHDDQRRGRRDRRGRQRFCSAVSARSALTVVVTSPYRPRPSRTDRPAGWFHPTGRSRRRSSRP